MLSDRVAFRLDDADRRAIEGAAELFRLTLSDFIRNAAVDTARRILADNERMGRNAADA